MDKNFRVRLVITLMLFAVAFLGLYTFDAIPFKIIFGIFCLMGAVELLSFWRRKINAETAVLTAFELVFLVCGVIFVSSINVDHFWYMILGVPGYDISAYCFGKLCGGKIFKKSRPFPHVSKNKTWEGTVLGLTAATAMVAGLMAARGAFEADWMYLMCGPLALVGDLFESFLKRRFGVKDSNEIIIKNKFFRKVEIMVGGSEGHGGFLDRVDSTVFTSTVLLLVSVIAQHL